MTFSSLLIHTCDISRFSEGVPDDYGIPVKTWTVHWENEPCRLVSTKGREVKVGAEVVISDYKLFVGNLVIATERDRVSNIRTSEGLLLDSSVYEILLVKLRSDGIGGHHHELVLQKVE